MKSCHRRCLHFIFVGLLASIAAPAVHADWFEGDDYKMHFPQLPDPNGWDVPSATPVIPNNGSWPTTGNARKRESSAMSISGFLGRGTVLTQLKTSTSVFTRTSRKVPDGWSIPGARLWSGEFAAGVFKLIPYGQGEQDGYDPVNGDVFLNDHVKYYQINITDIPQPFVQQRGEIYWLDISVDLAGEGEIGTLGLKTSKNHFMDDAVYLNPNGVWTELRDPGTGESLDTGFRHYRSGTGLVCLVWLWAR